MVDKREVRIDTLDEPTHLPAGGSGRVGWIVGVLLLVFLVGGVIATAAVTWQHWSPALLGEAGSESDPLKALEVRRDALASHRDIPGLAEGLGEVDAYLDEAREARDEKLTKRAERLQEDADEKLTQLQLRVASWQAMVTAQTDAENAREQASRAGAEPAGVPQLLLDSVAAESSRARRV